MKTKFKQYKRKGLSEMVPYVDFTGDTSVVSISDADLSLPNEEFRLGYIARNPKNHSDMWYVAKKYFDDNLEPVESTNPLDAAEFLKSKGIKDTLYDVDNPGQWIKGGLSRLLDQYATQRTAEVGDDSIGQKLADWSRKYPRGGIYSMSQKKMDDELIALEEEAKALFPPSRTAQKFRG